MKKNNRPKRGSLGIIDNSGGLISDRRVCIVSRSRISETSRFPNHHITRTLALRELLTSNSYCSRIHTHTHTSTYVIHSYLTLGFSKILLGLLCTMLATEQLVILRIKAHRRGLKKKTISMIRYKKIEFWRK